MRNLKLLEKFIRDNFNEKDFRITYYQDCMATLVDNSGDRLTLLTVRENHVIAKINGKDHLEYRLGYDLYGDKVWFVY